MFSKKRLVSWLPLVVIAILMAGCIDENSPVSPLPASQPDLEALLALPLAVDWPSAVLRAGYPWPDSPDQAIANFRDAYDGEDLGTFASMLSPEFHFVLQAETIEEYHLPRGLLGASDEIRIAFNMFLGLPSHLGDRLTGIAIARMDPLSPWEPVPGDDAYFGNLAGAERRRYDVLMTFAREGHGDPFTVTGEVQFVVVPEPVGEIGATRTAYRLAGAYDKTIHAAGTDETLWGSLKVQFR